MKRFLYAIALLVLPNHHFGQNGTVEHWIKNAVQNLENNHLESAQNYFDSALNFVSINTPNELPSYCLMVATKYRNHRLFELSDSYYQIAFNKKESVTDSIFLVDLYNERGLWNYDQSLYSISLLEFSKSLEMAIMVEDTLGQIISKINIGNVFKDIGDFELALKYYQQSHDQSLNLPVYNVKCLNNIGTIYIEQGLYDKAKDPLNKALEIANSNDFSSIRIDIFINLGIIDKKLSNLSKAKDWFEKALKISDITPLKKLLCLINLYDVAIKTNATKEISSLEIAALELSSEVQETTSQIELYEIISSFYQSQGNLEKALFYQNKLIEIKDDLHLHESKVYQQQLQQDLIYKQAIDQLNSLGTALESEIIEKNKISKENKDLSKTNTIIIVLASISILLLLSLIFALFTYYKKSKKYNQSLQEKATELALQNEEIINSMEYAHSMERLLVQQMNPHFIFNSLTTIEASISIGELDYAKNYLQVFSGMLRKTLDYSRSSSIPLIDEINFLKSYIDLHQLNQKETFECAFIYDEEEVNDFVYTPPMLVQPFIENALLHGLYHKTSGIKKLIIQIEPEEHFIVWTIEDNGIGREKASSIKKQHVGVSHGTKITADRIQWMQNIYKQQLSVEYIDLKEGTKVILKTPIIES